MSDSWREADTGYIIYTEDDDESWCAYSPDGVGIYAYDSKAEMLEDVTPVKIVRVGIETWERHYD
jgi:hypothetical protein